jgi:hypothetical protein
MPENRETETEMIHDMIRMVRANNRKLEESIARMEAFRASLRELREGIEPKPRPNLTLMEGGKDGDDA